MSRKGANELAKVLKDSPPDQSLEEHLSHAIATKAGRGGR